MWAPGPVWTCRVHLACTGCRVPDLQPAASRFTCMYSVSSKGTGNFRGVQRTGSETGHSTPSSAGLKDEGSVPPLVMQTRVHIRTDVCSPVGTSGDQQSANHVTARTRHCPYYFHSAHSWSPKLRTGGGAFLESVTHFSSGQSHPLFPPGAAVTCLTAPTRTQLFV